MQTFIGTKIVNARPMNRQEYNDFRGWTVPAGENPADDGYLVEYTDGGKANTSEFAGYVSWSPKEQFDGAYTEVPSLGRSLAPHQLRVVAEKAELDDRLSKLNAFFCTSIFLGLDAIERGRLYAHASVMNDYSAVSMNDEQLDAAPNRNSRRKKWETCLRLRRNLRRKLLPLKVTPQTSMRHLWPISPKATRHRLHRLHRPGQTSRKAS
jgi:hypothetical protein